MERDDEMHIIIKGRPGTFGKTRSEQEENMRKEWGQTMSDEQLDKLKHLERKVRDVSGSGKNFLQGNHIDMVE